ncbi:MAG: group II intron reverse transcriptase domain-containing protein [Candidatus Yanofskybacteria bacterium]|nr:group II intron reverse transcriptase domain-containing protein [Candidatus Yanofskybacteria bacterium]
MTLNVAYDSIFSYERLFASWRAFARGKRQRADVAAYAVRLIDNISSLHRDLANGTWQHGGYRRFCVSDPKPRIIHKASVRDRIVHHAIMSALGPYFERRFIPDSYSCRIGKGTHCALGRFAEFIRSGSRNDTRTCWVLQCDIRKCFASLDQRVLIALLSRHVPCEKLMRVLRSVIESYSSGASGAGIPLGNLTSQLFVNVYLHELDRFMGKTLRCLQYIRYADDFAVVSPNRAWLMSLVPHIRNFLGTALKLQLHPGKLTLRTVASGVDFLGWVHFPNHRVLRTATKRRMFHALRRSAALPTVASYLGLLGNGNTHRLVQMVRGLAILHE